MIPSDGTWKGENPLRDHSYCIRSLTVTAYDLEWIYSPVTWVLESKIPWNLQELSVVHIERGWLPHTPLSASTRPTIRLDTLADSLYVLSLNSVYINWSECAFENLRVLKLARLRFLRLNEFEQVLASSPALQVLEIQDTSLHGKRTSSKPLCLPNLRTLHISYMKTGLEIIAGMFEPGDYNIELDVSWVNAITPPRVSSKARWLQEIQIAAHKMRNITIVGIGDHTCALEEEYLLSVIIDLPNLITLRLHNLELGSSPLVTFEKALRALPQTKKIQMIHVSILDVETFKDVIGRCSVERIELINCWIFRNGKGALIERKTMMY